MLSSYQAGFRPGCALKRQYDIAHSCREDRLYDQSEHWALGAPPWLWGWGMHLSNDLVGKDLMFHCPSCHGTIVKKGSWIKSVRTFKCESCGATVRMTYEQKQAIFERHLASERPDGSLG